jgi:effector-binding domain-containing protein
MFTKIFYIIVIALIIFVFTGLILPPTVHVERSIEIDRPASTVFTILNSFTFFSAWSPWSERDPDIVYGYSGPASGVGARLNWSGDPRLVGSGWQEITQSNPWSMIRTQLDFDQQGRVNSYYQIDETGSGALVTWGFDTNLVEGNSFFGSLLARYFGLFFDQWIGSDYEQGLIRLKSVAESLPATDFSGLEVEIIEAEPMDILYIAVNGRQSPGGIATGLAAAHREIATFMAKHSIARQSPPMTINRGWDARDYEVHAAIPASATDVELSGVIKSGKSPSGLAVKVVHHGPYDRMSPSYEKLAAYMAATGLEEGRVSWEHYISDPAQTPAGEIITHIYFLTANEK